MGLHPADVATLKPTSIAWSSLATEKATVVINESDGRQKYVKDEAGHIIHLTHFTIDFNHIHEIDDETDDTITISGSINGEICVRVLTGEEAQIVKRWLDKEYEYYVAYLESTNQEILQRERPRQSSSSWPPPIEEEPLF